MKLKVLALALLSTYATHSFAEDNTEKTSSSSALKNEGSLLESPISKDLAILIGTKVWYNTWSLPIAFSSTGKPADSDMIASFKSENKLSTIPQLGFKFKDFMLTSGYFTKTKYTFGTQKIDQYYVPDITGLYPALVSLNGMNGTISQAIINTDSTTPLAIKVPISISPSADRSEFDMNLGYYLTPNIALTLGYKQIKRNYTYVFNRPKIAITNYQSQGIPQYVATGSACQLYQKQPDGSFSPVGDYVSSDGNYQCHTYSIPVESIISVGTQTLGEYAAETQVVNVESKGKGLALGITGSVPIGSSLNLYGSMAYGLLRTTYSGYINEKYTNPYYLGELGVNYTLPATAMIKAAIFSLGYRFQRYEFKNFLKSGQNATDTTDGFAASINVVF